MSTTRNFRVIINLSNFYRDHRHSALIYISEDIQKISDLEDRIEKVFGIKNFHLTSQNQYLPPSEDVRILQKDDIIWVVQNRGQYEDACMPEILPETNTKVKDIHTHGRKRSASTTEEYNGVEVKSPKKKKADPDKHKKNARPASPLNEEPQKKKRKNKSSVVTEEKINESDVEVKDTSSKPKKKKEKIVDDNSSDKISARIQEVTSKPRDEVMKINTLLPVLHSHISTYNKKIANKADVSCNNYLDATCSIAAKEIESDDDKKHQTSCKGDLLSYKKSVPLPTITDDYLQKKKINIVKIEVVGSSRAQRNELEENCHKKQNIWPNTTLDARSGDNQNSVETENHVTPPVKASNEMSTSSSADSPATSRPLLPDQHVTYRGIKRPTLPSDQEEQWQPEKSTVHKPSLESSNSKTTISKEDPTTNDIHSQRDQEEIALTDGKLGSFALGSNASTPNAAINQMPDSLEITLKKWHQGLAKLFSTSTARQESPTITTPNKSDNAECPTLDYNTESTSATNAARVAPTNESLAYDLGKNGTHASSDAIALLQTKEGNNEWAPSVKGQTETSFAMGTFGKDIDSSGRGSMEWTDARPESSENNVHLINDTLSESLPSTSVRDADCSMVDDMNNTRNTLDETIRNSNGLAFTSNSTPSISSNASTYTGIGQLLQDLRGNDSVMSLGSAESDCKDKKQRKRVRKRRRNNKAASHTSLDSSLVITGYIPPKLNPGYPLIHIKFDEVEGEDEPQIIDKSGRSITDTSSVEHITINSDADESKLEMAKVREEDILKAPSMKEMLPKVGDLIAFKIYRMTDNYSPEISSYITGKVTEFDVDTKEVEYEILSGLDQCKEPNGKLSVELGEEREITHDNRRVIAWKELIDPRLLFP